MTVYNDHLQAEEVAKRNIDFFACLLGTPQDCGLCDIPITHKENRQKVRESVK
jgi:hypothetical protein